MKSSKIYQQFGPWAIVTGASSGIGEEYSKQLAAHGFHLVLVARRLDLLEKHGAELSKKWGIQYRTVQADLSLPESYKKVIEASDDLDVGLLISNAGTGRSGRFLNRSEDDLLQIVHINALSHTWLTHYLGRKFIQRGKGGIALTGAMGATSGVPFMAIESGTKAFIEGFGKSLHWELKDKGVHVTVLVTTPTETPIIKELGFTKENTPVSPITTGQCVKETLKALSKNQVTVLPGLKFRIMNALMPDNLSREMMGKTMKKNNHIQ